MSNPFDDEDNVGNNGYIAGGGNISGNNAIGGIGQSSSSIGRGSIGGGGGGSGSGAVVNYNNQEQILEGFLCPICMIDLRTPDRLTEHVESQHSEEQDILKSFKDILMTAKKKIRNFDEKLDLGQALDSTLKSTFVTQTQQQQQNFYPLSLPQDVGTDVDHTAYFKAIRTPRLERYATETNKLIIRLHKLLTDRPSDQVQLKLHEQSLVPWLDGKSVKLCPNCAKKFNLTRRQHHCRLCGTIMCHDCSQFLALTDAISLVNPTVLTPTEQAEFTKDINKDDISTRICEHCLHLLANRKDQQDSQTYRPPIIIYYEKIVQLKKEITPDAKMYTRMINSLYEGDSIFSLADASALRSKIGHVAEKIDAYSKAILSLECEKGSCEEKLKKSVRLSCIHYIKDEMLSLDPLPLESDIQARQKKRLQETQQRIERERRLAMERWERANANLPNTANNNGGVGSSSGGNSNGILNSDKMKLVPTASAITSIDNWSGSQANKTTAMNNDPLVEQINIIKGYIKQARDALRFEEVETLELNLRELQQEFYLRYHQPDTISAT